MTSREHTSDLTPRDTRLTTLSLRSSQTGVASLACKSRDFREESEWRLIYTRSPDHSHPDDPPLSVRSRGEFLVPYVELRVLSDPPLDGWDRLPIRSVTCGPTREPAAVAEGLALALQAAGYPVADPGAPPVAGSVEVRVSTTTLRH